MKLYILNKLVTVYIYLEMILIVIKDLKKLKEKKKEKHEGQRCGRDRLGHK